MIVPLARKTLLYEWRRFLPAALSVAFSGVLLLMQAALIFGIFNTAGVYIRASSADLWLGFPGTQSIDLGHPIDRDVEMFARMDPNAARVEPFQWIDGNWRGPASHGNTAVFISGIDPGARGLMFSALLRGPLRQRLREPGGVIIDQADLDKLGVQVGQTATINGHRVRVVGEASGLRALGGVNVVASLDTARELNDDPATRDEATYYVVRVRDPATLEATRARLAAVGRQRHFDVWTRDDFARRAVRYWMFETGAGLGVLFLVGVVCVVGVIITSQTLMSAVAGSVREYATLQALGVSFRGLSRVVLEQAGWVGALGLAVGAVVCVAFMALARRFDVPVVLDASTALACVGLIMTIAMASGLMALRVLRRAEPATLLR